MTISAQVPDRDNLNPSLAERPTHGLSSKHPFVVDSFALLDHRTRERAIPAVGAPPGRYLSFEHGAVTKLIALERPITHIGRGLIADVRLEDSHVSRRHAILAVRSEGARVLDDRSSNGTYVNGRAVTVAPLSDGDVLRFGRAVFRYTEIVPRGRTRPLRRIPMTRGVSWREPSGAPAA
jgi:FHA domain-containing protein